MVIDTTVFLHKALKENKAILLEGQLGSLRDPDHGIYPFTTSSSPLAGFGTVGAGVPAGSITDVYCVTKAYSSCVGAGPFATELFGAEADELRNRGGDAGEYGATTGRPRRVGWFDAVATRYGCMVQGATECVLTNLDVLGYLDEIPVCTAYEADGRQITDFPSTPTLLRCKPVYTHPARLEKRRARRDPLRRPAGELPPVRGFSGKAGGYAHQHAFHRSQARRNLPPPLKS
jgi:adenylosuccinate synthase